VDEAMTHANFEFGDDRMLPTPLDGYGLTWPPPASRARTLLGPRVTRERGAAMECVHGRICVSSTCVSSKFSTECFLFTGDSVDLRDRHV
jgi:hypothetical protein